MNLAQQAWENGNIRLAQELLDAQRPGPGREDLRDFAWRYLWRVCRDEGRATLFTFRGRGGLVQSLAVSPDGRVLATGGGEGNIRLWEVAILPSGGRKIHRGARSQAQEVALLRGHRGDQLR
jgi:WD40 repeat protein